MSSHALPEEIMLKQHEALVVNCFAQSEALAVGSGRKSGELNSDGNRPSTTILGTRLDPYTLGQLVSYKKSDMLKFRNFGKKSLSELEDLIEEKGLTFGFNIAKYNLEN